MSSRLNRCPIRGFRRKGCGRVALLEIGYLPLRTWGRRNARQSGPAHPTDLRSRPPPRGAAGPRRRGGTLREPDLGLAADLRDGGDDVALDGDLLARKRLAGDARGPRGGGGRSDVEAPRPRGRDGGDRRRDPALSVDPGFKVRGSP